MAKPNPFRILKKAMAYAMSTTVEKKYRLDEFLHYSSLPYCALRKLHDTLDKGGFFLYEDMEFGMRYYTSVGTTVHEGIQEYMSMLGADRDEGEGNTFRAKSLGAVVGDYACEKCGTKYPFSTNPFCAKCGLQMEYHELGVEFGKHMIGHSDGLYEYASGRYIVIDYKTTSSKAIWVNANKTPIFPYKKNVAQIESYCVSMEEQYDITIDGWALIYMARDNPMAEGQTVISGKIMTEKRKDLVYKRLLKADRHWPIMLRVEDVDSEDMQKLIDQKPCKSYEQYDRQFGEPFNECPLLKVCFDETKLKKRLGKVMRENYELLPLRNNLRAALEVK